MAGSSINSRKSNNIKFICSYDGKILPRHPDGKLRYHGGETRVLSVKRSIAFAELMVKLGEMCGGSVSLRCQLPTEDLDALVSITSDEDLANLIEEYDHTAIAPSPSSSLKIRSFLSPPKSAKKVTSPNSSMASSSSTMSANSPKSSRYNCPINERCVRQTMAKPQVVFPLCYQKVMGKLPQYAYHGPGYTASSHIYPIHHGNH
ncbi:protein PAL OF QUIRKY-like [Lycium barbarum]|uniref:protein PAL OF QUIRKY-like n=1 Tax=Lycium barbarum TaxID=112863 RepID=UPI00293E22B4|nr:protein PAL OF QUIRKY-like [Lycium barbarum]